MKTEIEVKKLIKDCSVYLIIQRPLLYIDNLIVEDDLIKFNIFDGNDKFKPLKCTLDSNTFFNNESYLLEALFFSEKDKQLNQPFNKIAGFKLYKKNTDFVVWYTPQKFMYEYLFGILKKNNSNKITGNIGDFVNYKIHYIGKAFDQDIWDRLTGHISFQSVLTKEDTINESINKNSYEISLILLNIDSFQEHHINELTADLLDIAKNDLILHEMNDSFFKEIVSKESVNLTNEVEALLVNLFKPEYNKIKYLNYPKLSSGTKNLGYSKAYLNIDRLIAYLSTDNYKITTQRRFP